MLRTTWKEEGVSLQKLEGSWSVPLSRCCGGEDEVRNPNYNNKLGCGVKASDTWLQNLEMSFQLYNTPEILGAILQTVVKRVMVTCLGEST